MKSPFKKAVVGQVGVNKISTFLNLSGANSGYRRHDHFKKRDLVLSDTTFTEVLGSSVTTEIEYDNDGNIIGAHKTFYLALFNGFSLGKINPYTHVQFINTLYRNIFINWKKDILRSFIFLGYWRRD